MQFSQKLLELRKKRGFSQEDLAEKLNVSRQAISRWEMGSAMPDSSNLLKISDLFGVSIDSLLHEDDQPEGKPMSGENQKERNRQVALAVLVGLHAMALLVGLTALFGLQNTLAAWGAMALHLANMIGFEAGLRYQGAKNAKDIRKQYYRICIWLFAFVPVYLLVKEVWYLYPRPHLAILEDTSALLVYGLLCGMIWNKCRRTQKNP